MSTAPTDAWYEANQRYLIAALAEVRRALERYGARAQEVPGPDEPGRTLQEALGAMPAPPALESLAEIFGLTPFERDLLLLCAGVELDSSFAACCASAQDDPRRAYPTFGLALAALPVAHWSAITPAAPLRHWRLVEVGTGDALTTSPCASTSARYTTWPASTTLTSACRASSNPSSPDEPTSLTARRGGLHHGLWSRTDGALSKTAVQLCGGEDAAKRAIASAASAAAGLRAYAIRATDVPAAASQREDTGTPLGARSRPERRRVAPGLPGRRWP